MAALRKENEGFKEDATQSRAEIAELRYRLRLIDGVLLARQR